MTVSQLGRSGTVFCGGFGTSAMRTAAMTKSTKAVP